MPTVTDPVTGLPLLQSYIPDDIVQIPFNTQVFPWDDYKAADRPARGAAYPDDLLNTSANLAGQNQTNPIYMQTVYTDGSHRLLVSDQHGSSGTAPFDYLLSDANQGLSTPGNGNPTELHNYSGISWIYYLGVSVSFVSTLPSGTAAPWLNIGIGVHNSPPGLVVLNFMLSGNASAAQPAPSAFHDRITFLGGFPWSVYSGHQLSIYATTSGNHVWTINYEIGLD